MPGRLVSSAVGAALTVGGFLSAVTGPVGSVWHYGGALAVLAGGLLLVRLVDVYRRQAVDVSARD